VRSLKELLSKEPAWPMVQTWLAAATNDIRTLPVERANGERTLTLLQVTTRAPLGAIALETGGLVADHGWLRLLGADEGELMRGLAGWNGLAGSPRLIDDAFLVGHDAVGGFFALNGGAFVGDPGHVFYFAPDTLDWMDMEMGYSAFLQWVCTGEVGRFYAELRWPGWELEVSSAPLDEGFHLYPPPFAAEGKPVGAAQRELVPMTELWEWYQECGRRFAGLPEGASLDIDLTD
jgi:hypothetical protein